MMRKYRLNETKTLDSFSALQSWKSRLWQHFHYDEFTRIQAENIFTNYTCSMRAERVFNSMLAADAIIQVEQTDAEPASETN